MLKILEVREDGRDVQLGRRMLKKVYKLSDEQAPLPAYTFFNARLACFENLCRNIAGFMVD